MEQVLKGDDLTPMVAEVKNVAKAIRAMEADVVAAGFFSFLFFPSLSSKHNTLHF